MSRIGEGSRALKGACVRARDAPGCGSRRPFSLSVLACIAVGGTAAASDVPQDGLLLHGPFARKPKRIRTAFSPSQLLRLERAFEKNHYVVGAERKQLAGSLSLSETQVTIAPPAGGRCSPGSPVGGGSGPVPEQPESSPRLPGAFSCPVQKATRAALLQNLALEPRLSKGVWSRRARRILIQP